MPLEPTRRVRALYERVDNKVQRMRMGPAQVAEYQGRSKKALDLWTERAKKNPNDIEARVSVIRMLRLIGSEHESREQLDALIAEVGRPVQVLREVAQAAEQAEEWVVAADAWDAAHAVDPNDDVLLLGLAGALCRCHRHDKAEALFRVAAAKSDDVRHQGLIGLANVAQGRSDANGAVTRWGLVEEEYGQSVESVVGRASAHLLLGDIDRADAVLQKGVEAFPTAYMIHQLICRVAQSTCDFETWERHLSLMIPLRPNSTYLRTQRALAANNLGDVFLYWRDLDYATDRYRRDAWNGSADGLADLINVLLRKGEWEEAQTLLPPLVDECLQRPTGPTIRAAVNGLVWIGDLAGLAFLADTINQELCSSQALVELANACVILERENDALALVERIENVDSRRAIELRAWALARQGDAQTARSLIMNESYPRTLQHYRALDKAPLGELHSVRITCTPDELNGSVVAMSVCRDEIDRLPEWFDHYRDMGVEHFIIIDNGSTDGTLEFLTEQADVQLFAAEGHYRPTASGRRWLNELMSKWCSGAWCLIADADEFLVFPEMDRGIASLTAYLDSTGAETMFAMMLDMYGDRLTTWNGRSAGTRMADLFPWFDSRTYLIGSRSAPYFSVSAGMRNLVLSSVMPESLLSKPVLVKGGRDIVHLTSHTITPCRGADVTGVFLHYKFAVDPKPRSTFSSSKGVFARLLASDLATTRALELRSEHSVKYETPAQLIELGLMRPGARFAGIE